MQRNTQLHITSHYTWHTQIHRATFQTVLQNRTSANLWVWISWKAGHCYTAQSDDNGSNGQGRVPHSCETKSLKTVYPALQKTRSCNILFTTGWLEFNGTFNAIQVTVYRPFGVIIYNTNWLLTKSTIFVEVKCLKSPTTLGWTCLFTKQRTALQICILLSKEYLGSQMENSQEKWLDSEQFVRWE